MEIRKLSQATTILDTALEYWNLSINEKEVLDNVLIILAKNNVSKLTQLQYLLDDETEDLLERLNKHDIIAFATERLDLICSDDEDDLVEALEKLKYNFLDKADFNEMTDYVEKEGYSIEYCGSNVDIITASQLEEMKDLFLSFSAEKRQEIINSLK